MKEIEIDEPNTWWHGCMKRDGCKCGYIFDAGENVIAKVFYNDPTIALDDAISGYDKNEGLISVEEAHANMCMMAAAKDMYEALKELLADPGLDDMKPTVWDKAWSAVARAEGK